MEQNPAPSYECEYYSDLQLEAHWEAGLLNRDVLSEGEEFLHHHNACCVTQMELVQVMRLMVGLGDELVQFL